MFSSQKNKTVRPLLVVFALLFLILMVAGAFVVGGLAGKLNISPFSQPINAAETMIRSTLARVRGHEQNERYFGSALLELKLTTLAAIPNEDGDRIGFARISDGYLVATRSGQLHLVDLQWPSDASVVDLALTIPTEKDRFLQHPINKKHLRIPVQFGVKGLYAEETQDQVHIYASYHFWKQDQECAVFRLARTEVNKDELLQVSDSPWTVLYESNPCMKLDGKFNRLGEDDTFLQAGGRIAEYDQNRLIFSVGDHFLEGIHNTDHVQDVNASYGKLWLVDKRSGNAEMFSLGHRNVQGLTVDQYGLVWASEHGPRGGDELNQPVAGGNYGWPLASFGTLYAGYTYPEGKDWSDHSGFEQPKYTWSPSIAPSNLVRLNNSRFQRWGDDLILTSLSGRSIHRMRLDQTQVVAVEPIEIGDRLRDIAQTPDGDLLMMSDRGTFYKLSPAEEFAAEGGADNAEANTAARGRALWMTCAACHQASSSGQHRIGPNLHNIVGRNIAAYDNFNYSPAMAALDGRWTVDRLDQFLTDPLKDVPGTSMVFAGIEDENDRRVLIEFLQKGL